MNSNPKPAPDKKKPADDKTPPAPAAVPAAKPPALFRRIDWLALLISFGGVWIIYLLTLAPEVTLEDSGELCTGSFYAGIPHPPGYPFWALYSWVWTVILPFGNVAWRVEVGESFAAAMACGMVGLMVSRGSSMLIEGIESLKNLDRKAENAICLVCGAVAGLLMGLGGTMWSESVAINRISLFGAPWIMLVAVCLLRWIHSPQQRRYLYVAWFCFGICTTIHQTLLIAAMAVEVGVIAANKRLGRTFCLGNVICWIVGLIAYNSKASTAMSDVDNMFKVIFMIVGISSIIGYVVLAFMTEETPAEFSLDASFAAWLLLGAYAAFGGGPVYAVLSLIGFGAFVWFTIKTWKLGHEPVVIFLCGFLVLLGASFYFYEPISGMTNPPMEWGYPRTVEGFFHALERGQYEKARPTDLFSADGRTRFVSQLWFLMHGVTEEFNWVLLFVALVPFCFFLRMQKRERAWTIFLAALYGCIGFLLVIIMNPGDDRSSVDLHRVFFASSHGVIAILIGYGMALIAATMAANYERFRQWGLLGGAIAAVVALGALWETTSKYYFGPGGRIPIGEFFHWVTFAFGPNRAGLPVYGGLILIGLALVFIAGLQLYRNRAPLALTLGIFAVLPIYSGMCHWASSEQRNHWFGYWFGHDMFTPPYGVYPEMTRDAILFGGTDPGRFCPTYMIFCESFIPHKDQPAEDQKFDRRDVYIITQNALADNTYLEYIRAQYNRSTQIDPPFFQEFLRSTKEKKDGYRTNTIARLAYKLLDEPLTRFGKRVEDRRRAEGVYPAKEIYIPTGEDSERCYAEYYNDATARAMHDQNDPTGPRQLRQGEDVKVQDGRLSISGQVAVMAINGLFTKVIFDRNPSNEFFVEESFPLEWMYPYLTPFGVIMKINRHPLDVMGDDVVKKDHEFWSRYSERTVGNWITYDTPVKQICDFARRVYQERDFTGFTGNPRFIRDDQAQKAFSKLRSSIGGLYDWRVTHASGKDPAEQQRMIKEADFAYRQAFAFCPFSPEAVVRYVTLLVRTQRFDDALLVAQTCSDFDPNNGAVEGLVRQIQDMKNNGAPQQMSLAQVEQAIQQMQKQLHDKPNDFQNAFYLASAYLQLQRTNNAVETLETILANPKADEAAVVSVAKLYSQIGDFGHLESTLEHLTKIKPNSPEAWYDLAAIKAFRGKGAESFAALRHSMDENAKRLAKDPKASDLNARAKTDAAFNSLRASPEFKEIVK